MSETLLEKVKFFLWELSHEAINGHGKASISTKCLIKQQKMHMPKKSTLVPKERVHQNLLQHHPKISVVHHGNTKTPNDSTKQTQIDWAY